MGALRGLADPTASPNAAGLTSGFDMSPGVTRPLWPDPATCTAARPRHLKAFRDPSLGAARCRSCDGAGEAG